MKNEKQYAVQHLKDLNDEKNELLEIVETCKNDIASQLPKKIGEEQEPIYAEQLISEGQKHGLSSLVTRLQAYQEEVRILEKKLADSQQKLTEIEKDANLLNGITDRRGEYFLGYDRHGRSYWSVPIHIDADSRKQISGLLINEPNDNNKWYTINSAELVHSYYHALSPHGKRENALRIALYKMYSQVGISLTSPKEILMESETWIHLDRSFTNFYWWLCNSPATEIPLMFISKYSKPIRDLIMQMHSVHCGCDRAFNTETPFESINGVKDFLKVLKDNWFNPKVILLKEKEQAEFGELVSVSHLFSWLSNLNARLEIDVQNSLERQKLEQERRESVKLKRNNELQKKKEKEKDANIITSRSGRRVVLPSGWAAPTIDIIDTNIKRANSTSRKKTSTSKLAKGRHSAETASSRRPKISNPERNDVSSVSSGSNESENISRNHGKRNVSDGDFSDECESLFETPEKKRTKLNVVYDSSPIVPSSSPEVIPQRTAQGTRRPPRKRSDNAKSRSTRSRLSIESETENDSNDEVSVECDSEPEIIYETRSRRSKKPSVQYDESKYVIHYLIIKDKAQSFKLTEILDSEDE